MNKSNERINSWLAGANQKRAEYCPTWLRGHLAIGLFDGSAPLRDFIGRNADTYLRLLTNSPRMCKVVDGEWLFLSSADLTQQAFTINIELGMLVRGGTMPKRVEQQFDRLIHSGQLKQVD